MAIGERPSTATATGDAVPANQSSSSSTVSPLLGPVESGVFAAAADFATAQGEGDEQIIDLNENDVISGRGDSINRHPGNVQFRQMVDKDRRAYLASHYKRNKRLIANNIVEAIRQKNPAGRFLIKDPETELWIQMDCDRAREKTAQALRENSKKLRVEIESDRLRKSNSVDSAEEDSAAEPAHSRSGNHPPLPHHAPSTYPLPGGAQPQVWGNHRPYYYGYGPPVVPMSIPMSMAGMHPAGMHAFPPYRAHYGVPPPYYPYPPPPNHPQQQQQHPSMAYSAALILPQQQQQTTSVTQDSTADLPVHKINNTTHNSTQNSDHQQQSRPLLEPSNDKTEPVSVPSQPILERHDDEEEEEEVQQKDQPQVHDFDTTPRQLEPQLQQQKQQRLKLEDDNVRSNHPGFPGHCNDYNRTTKTTYPRHHSPIVVRGIENNGPEQERDTQGYHHGTIRVSLPSSKAGGIVLSPFVQKKAKPHHESPVTSMNAQRATRNNRRNSPQFETMMQEPVLRQSHPLPSTAHEQYTRDNSIGRNDSEQSKQKYGLESPSLQEKDSSLQLKRDASTFEDICHLERTPKHARHLDRSDCNDDQHDSIAGGRSRLFGSFTPNRHGQQSGHGNLQLDGASAAAVSATVSHYTPRNQQERSPDLEALTPAGASCMNALYAMLGDGLGDAINSPQRNGSFVGDTDLPTSVVPDYRVSPLRMKPGTYEAVSFSPIRANTTTSLHQRNSSPRGHQLQPRPYFS